MTITALTDPNALPNQSQSQDAFDANMAAMIANLPLRAQQENELAANLNTLAAGGAYAIPYVWGVATTAGRLSSSPAASENVALGFDISNVAATGLNMLPALQQMGQGSSAVRGQLRVVKTTDPAAFLLFNITQRTDNGSYQHFDGSMIHASTTNPFAVGDPVMLFFQRTGDKGDTGPVNPLTSAKLSDRKASGTAGGTSVANDTTQTRALNTTEHSTIAGISLSSNQVTLPAGTYDIFARVPGYMVDNHQAYLYNVTDSTYAIVGSAAFTPGAAAVQTDSIISGRLVLAAAKTFTIRHWTKLGAATNGLGVGTNNAAQPGTFTEITFTKVA